MENYLQNFVMLVFLALVVLFFWTLFYLIPAFIIRYFRNRQYGQIKFDNVDYYREIPCDNNLSLIYFISLKYRLIENKYDIINAYILRFIFDKKIIIQDDRIDNFKLDLSNLKTSDDIIEQGIITCLKKASVDNILTGDNFNEWIGINTSEIADWYNEIDKESKRMLFKNDLIKENRYGILTPTNELKSIATKIQGFKKFLLDFSIINERKSEEVFLWKDYLVIASVLGIADKVDNDLKELYSNFNFSYNCLEISKIIKEEYERNNAQGNRF